MRRRRNLKQITESQEQDKKIIVEHACSLEREIRFYIDKDCYAVAREDSDGTILIGYENDEAEETVKRKENIFTRIKKQIKNKELFKNLILNSKEMIKDKDFLRTLAFSICEVIFIVIIVEFQFFIVYEAFENNNFIYMGLFGFTFLLITLVHVIIDDLMFLSHSIRSKHSAEHMMANFLEKNNRLPRSMEEMMSSSRFTVDCGSRKKIHYDVEMSIVFLISAILSYPIVTFLIQPKCKNESLEFFLSMIVLTSMGLCYNYFKFAKKLRFLVKIVENALNYVMQLVNTTKNVTEKDLQIAYCAANLWLWAVYPQFYSEEDNIFREKDKN